MRLYKKIVDERYECTLRDLHTYQYFIKFNIFQPFTPLGVQKKKNSSGINGNYLSSGEGGEAGSRRSSSKRMHKRIGATHIRDSIPLCGRHLGKRKVREAQVRDGRTTETSGEAVREVT